MWSGGNSARIGWRSAGVGVGQNVLGARSDIVALEVGTDTEDTIDKAKEEEADGDSGEDDEDRSGDIGKDGREDK